MLLISSKSKPNSVAGAIAYELKKSSSIQLQAVGAGAINQAIKAIAIARGYVAPLGFNLVCIPAFTNVKVEGEEKTGMIITVLK